jgi:predicted permease
MADFWHACRAIARMPVLATVVIVSLGIGIGVNTVVFSWIQYRLLQPLPGVPRSASLHLVEPRTETGAYPGASWLEYHDLRSRLSSFRELIAFRMAPVYVGETGSVERAYGLLVSGNYFEALGVRPAIGRFMTPGEVPPPHGFEGADTNESTDRGEPVAVISHGLWHSRYAGASDIVGRTVRINGRDLTIIGVTPRGFQGSVLGLTFEVWVPATLAPELINGSRELAQRAVRGYSLMGRLRDDATRETAQAELDGAMRQLAQAYPEINATMRGEILRFWQSPRGPQRMMAYALVTLQALMLLLLLAVCGNTANLALARASARHKEMGVRLALGAGPWRIARLLLAENVVLALGGAVLALPIAYWGTQAFRTLPLSGLPVRFETELDALGLVFAMVLGAASGVLIGAAPALQMARVDPQLAFRSGLRTASRSRLRNALMGVQVALAIVVLLAAGVFFRNFMETRDTDPGFRREGVLLAAYDLSGRNAGQEFVRAFPSRLLDRLQTIPSIERAAISSSVPLDIHGMPSRVFTVEGWTRTEPGFDQALANTVTPQYFDVLDIPIVDGKGFAALTDAAAPPQVVVNQEFVRRYLSRVEPIGRKLQARGRTYYIAGVARDALYNAFGEKPQAIIYFSYRDNPSNGGEIHVRTAPGAENRVAPEVRRVVRELDADLPVFNLRTLTDHVEANLIFRRVPARLFAVLGPMLLVLAAIGIYAVVAYTVSLRTTEIGVRLAVGATPPRVVAQFVGDSLTVIVAGGLAGWLLAFIVALDVIPGGEIDPWVFTAVPALLLGVAIVACWIPAQRAARLDPVVALRRE